MSDSNEAQHKLKNFLAGFSALSPEAVDKLSELIPVIAPEKGSVLISEGEIPQTCYFVLKGLVRQYQFIDGTERTTEFYTESNGTISSAHFSNQTPSTFNLECMEDCLLIAGEMKMEEAHLEAFPELKEVIRVMLEIDLNKAKSSYSNFILSSPKERYEHFLKSRTDLANRVSLQHIASYLGMTPESLSRIRKRIVS